MTYEQTLWEVACQVVMYGGEQLDSRQADTVKKAVDRTYENQFEEFAPKPPQGWWRPAPDAGRITAGGLKLMGMAWDPPRDNHFIRHWDPPPQAGAHPWFDEPRVQ